MIRWAQFLVVWLLVLAVPAQGAAAATMAFCGPAHHGVEKLIASEQGALAGHHRSASNGQAHHHPAADVADVADAVQTASMDESASGGLVPADPHKCSACAACCLAGAILGAMPRVAAAEAGPTSFDAVVTGVPRFTTGGPDRPPRAVLA